MMEPNEKNVLPPVDGSETLGGLQKGMLPGVVCVQWMKCNKPYCHCGKGKLHGPYYCRFWKEGGRLRKKYIRKSEVEEVRKRCQSRRTHLQELKNYLLNWDRMLDPIRSAEQSVRSQVRKRKFSRSRSNSPPNTDG